MTNDLTLSMLYLFMRITLPSLLMSVVCTNNLSSNYYLRYLRSTYFVAADN
jgi:hypothetical protein